MDIKLAVTHIKGIEAARPIDADDLNANIYFHDADEAMRVIASLLSQFRNIPEIDTLLKSKGAIPLRDMLVWLLEEKFGLKVKEN